MEENLRRCVHSPLSDPESLSVCRTELTGTSSDASAITRDTCKDFSQHVPVPFPNQTTKWTDQQHNLYLNSLEASFISQLHHSLHLRGWSLQNNLKKAYRSIPLQNSLMPGQFLAVQDDCWKKICLERNEPMLESTADSHIFAGGPLTGHLASERSFTTRESDIHDHSMLFVEGIPGSKGSIVSSRQGRSYQKQSVCQLHHLESLDLTAEVTDQNFKDEDQGISSSYGPAAKRFKTITADASSNDQAVPLGKFHGADVSTSTYPSEEYREKELIAIGAPRELSFPKI